MSLSETSSLAKTKILFDGNCIVCDTEISHYKRVAPEIFEMIDISSADFDARRFGLTSAAVQKHMHVLTPDGQVLKGVDAFSHIWMRMERYRWAAKFVALPGVNGLARIGYEIFARYRHLLPKKKPVVATPPVE